jgi:serine/threonine protein kinase
VQRDKIIQNYRLIQFIGDGGMGQVWLAEHAHLGRKVAIKSLHPQFARNQAIRARFKQEASTLAHLHHPTIVALHDYIEAEDAAYLVMEYVDGIPLDDYIKNHSGPIPDPLLRDMFGQILEGFIYAHGQKIVHRDIKPGNFLVTPQGKVKILDFGIAKILTDTDRKLTKTGMNMGTVYYMSPEQVKGEAVDYRSDIYSLGVTLFQMATGRSPYPQDTTEFYVYDQIVNHPLPAASAFYPGVTAGMEAIIARATAKVPDQRFQDCRAFLEAVRSSEVLNLPAHPEPLALPVGEEARDTQLPRNNAKQPVVETPETPESPSEKPSAQEKPSGKPGTHELSFENAESNGKSSQGPQTQGPPTAPEAAAAPVTGDQLSADAPAARPKPTRKRRRGLKIFLLLFVLCAGGVALAFSMDLLPIRKKVDDSQYVIASSLFLRTKPDENAKSNEKIPYGSQVKIKSRPKKGWAEIDHNGKKAYVAEAYLVDYETFLEIDHLCKDADAMTLLRESTDKVAIHDYFKRNGLRADIPNGKYQEVYDEDPDPSKIWFVLAQKPDNVPNTVLKEVRLEKGYWREEEKQNTAVILVNKANPLKRRLVAFRYKETETGFETKDIATRSLDDCPDCLMQRVTYRDLGPYYIPLFDDLLKVRDALLNNKEGILLKEKGEYKPFKLLIWEGKASFTEIDFE